MIVFCFALSLTQCKQRRQQVSSSLEEQVLQEYAAFEGWQVGLLVSQNDLFLKENNSNKNILQGKYNQLNKVEEGKAVFWNTPQFFNPEQKSIQGYQATFQLAGEGNQSIDFSILLQPRDIARTPNLARHFFAQVESKFYEGLPAVISRSSQGITLGLNLFEELFPVDPSDIFAADDVEDSQNVVTNITKRRANRIDSLTDALGVPGDALADPVYFLKPDLNRDQSMSGDTDNTIYPGDVFLVSNPQLIGSGLGVWLGGSKKLIGENGGSNNLFILAKSVLNPNLVSFLQNQMRSGNFTLRIQNVNLKPIGQPELLSNLTNNPESHSLTKNGNTVLLTNNNNEFKNAGPINPFAQTKNDLQNNDKDKIFIRSLLTGHAEFTKNLNDLLMSLNKDFPTMKKDGFLKLKNFFDSQLTKYKSTDVFEIKPLAELAYKLDTMTKNENITQNKSVLNPINETLSMLVQYEKLNIQSQTKVKELRNVFDRQGMMIPFSSTTLKIMDAIGGGFLSHTANRLITNNDLRWNSPLIIRCAEKFTMDHRRSELAAFYQSPNKRVAAQQLDDWFTINSYVAILSKATGVAIPKLQDKNSNEVLINYMNTHQNKILNFVKNPYLVRSSNWHYYRSGKIEQADDSILDWFSETNTRMLLEKITGVEPPETSRDNRTNIASMDKYLNKYAHDIWIFMDNMQIEFGDEKFIFEKIPKITDPGFSRKLMTQDIGNIVSQLNQLTTVKAQMLEAISYQLDRLYNL